MAGPIWKSIFSLTAATGMIVGMPVESTASSGMVVVRAGTVITVSGREIPRGDIVIVDGKIDLIGANLEFPRTATVIDARDRVVMPGMINVATRQGMSGFARSGNNSGETAASEIILSLADFEPLLSNGFVAAAFVPTGNNIPGAASLYRLAGPNGPELLNERVYVPISMTNPGADKGQLRAAISQAKAEIEKAKKAREDFDKKQREEEAKRKAEAEKNGEADRRADEKPAEFVPPEIPANLRFFVDVLRDESKIPAIFDVSSGSDYIHLLDVLGDDLDKFGANLYFTTSSGDFREIVSRLGERQAHVIVGPSISTLPFTTVRYSIPAELVKAGCTVTTLPPFDSEGGYRLMRTRMADLVRTGWSREDVLKAVTLNPAKLMGIDGDAGTIEKGKRADLIFLDGDPLDPTSKVMGVMIGGEMVWEESK